MDELLWAMTMMEPMIMAETKYIVAVHASTWGEKNIV